MNLTQKLLAAPPLFQTMAVPGKEQRLKRIEVALNKTSRLHK
jgi:hypothetical protein